VTLAFNNIKKSFKTILLIGVAAVALSACASNRSTMPTPDYSGLSKTQAQATLSQLSARYKSNPRDKNIIIHFSAALRASGQSSQAISVLQQAVSTYPTDADIKVSYAKALATNGKFEQALTIINQTLRPESPDWNALSVKGAILDQMGQNQTARQLYIQALSINPNVASLQANLGLSYAMTNELLKAEQHLRKAISMRGANNTIHQNLALILGLQGRFDEARAIYSKFLSPEHVKSNMAYIRALLTQQNRWNVIPDSK